jgi:hypothetical protein
MHRSLAGLFACCVISACGSGTAPPVSNTPTPPPSTTNLSLRFFGTGLNDIDRVKIPLLGATSASRPVNIGATDFTIEFWVKGNVDENPTLACTTGSLARDAWLGGAVILDRDVLGDGDLGEFGVSFLGGQVAFGVSRGNAGMTLCGAANVLDGAWHHVALTRQKLSGQMTIFVDGAQEVSISNLGANGDVSYNPAHPAPNVADPLLVIGAQKRDDLASHAFRGLIDELRLSTRLRYNTGAFLRPSSAFTPDVDTAALYHFDEPSGTDIVDASNTNASPGALVPAAAGAAAHRSTDVPF